MSQEREVLEADVVIVGAGPAGLACALRLQERIEEHEAKRQAGEVEGPDLSEAIVLVLEKGRNVGDHVLSGAVMDPRGLGKLVPDFEERGCPGVPCTSDRVLYLTEKGRFQLPGFAVPKWLHNTGNRIVSIHRVVKWLHGIVEEKGVQVFPEFPGADLLVEDGRVAGVPTREKGPNKEGKPKPNFEPGMDVRAKVTVLAEGSRGSLTKQLVRRFELDRDRNPQVYATGVKEVWRVPGADRRKGEVVHTMGWPLRRDEFGGGWIYFMGEDLVSVGFVTGLDYADPTTDPHALFQLFKTHPDVRAALEGGDMLRYGAKTIPEGGWWSRPRPYVDGCLVVGDAGSNLNPARLKGIHLAIETGILAAETVFEALVRGDSSAAVLGGYEDRVAASDVKRELYAARNVHQAFERGMPWAFLDLGLQLVTGGRGLRDRYETVPGHLRMKKLSEITPRPRTVQPDGKLTFDKLTDVYHSGTTHEEDQPCHLVVTVDPDHCAVRCAEEYGNPCQHFCPAAVYEMVEDPSREDGRKVLRINAANCVHCKTCDIMDPYQVIEWKTPEGGGGPVYVDL